MKQLEQNCGYGFVAFSSNLQVKRAIEGSEFKRLAMEKLTHE